MPVKKGKAKKSTKSKPKAVEAPKPLIPEVAGPHDPSCRCRDCITPLCMVEIDFKLLNEAGIDHTSNFSSTLPSWSTIYCVATVVAEHFYQITNDITIFANAAATEELSPLQTLEDCGITGGPEANPPRTTLWVLSRGERFAGRTGLVEDL